jgi:hypothetical protein
VAYDLSPVCDLFLGRYKGNAGFYAITPCGKVIELGSDTPVTLEEATRLAVEAVDGTYNRHRMSPMDFLKREHDSMPLGVIVMQTPVSGPVTRTRAQLRDREKAKQLITKYNSLVDRALRAANQTEQIQIIADADEDTLALLSLVCAPALAAQILGVLPRAKRTKIPVLMGEYQELLSRLRKTREPVSPLR